MAVKVTGVGGGGNQQFLQLLQILSKMDINKDTSAQDTRVFNMEQATNNQVSTMLDGLTTSKQIEDARFLVDNNIASASDNLHSKAGAEENRNKYNAIALQNESYNAFMGEADAYITEIDDGTWDWKNFTMADYVHGYRLYNDFSDATSIVTGQTQRSDGATQTSTKPLGYTYKSLASNRDHNQVRNRMDEFKRNLDTSLVAFRNDGIIDDTESIFVMLGDKKGLELNIKNSTLSAVNNIKSYSQRYNALENVVNSFDAYVVKKGVGEGGLDKTEYMYEMSKQLDDHFAAFRFETDDNVDGEYYEKDSSSKQSNDFKQYLDDIATDATSLTPTQFRAKMGIKLSKADQGLNNSYRRYKFVTGIDYDAEAYSLKAQLTPYIEAMLAGSRGELIDNPWMFTINDTQLPDEALIANSNIKVDKSEYREGEIFYNPDVGFFKIGTQEEISKQTSPSPASPSTYIKPKEQFTIKDNKSLGTIAKEEGFQNAFDSLRQDTIKNDIDSTLSELEGVEEAIGRFNKKFNTEDANINQLSLLWDRMDSSKKKSYGSFNVFVDKIREKHKLQK